MKQILLILDSCTNISATIAIVQKLLVADAKLTAIYIIDSGWSNILGDEWISNTTTRNNFLKYMEHQKYQEASNITNALEQYAKVKGITVNTIIKAGVPQKIVVTAFSEYGPFDLVILPYPTKKFVEGTIRLKTDAILRELSCPILIGPP
jgi:hypothetical protein